MSFYVHYYFVQLPKSPVKTGYPAYQGGRWSRGWLSLLLRPLNMEPVWKLRRKFKTPTRTPHHQLSSSAVSSYPSPASSALNPRHSEPYWFLQTDQSCLRNSCSLFCSFFPPVSHQLLLTHQCPSRCHLLQKPHTSPAIQVKCRHSCTSPRQSHS